MNTGKKIYLLVCITCYSASSAVPSWDWLRNTCLGKQCSAIVNKAYKHPYLAVASVLTIAVALQQLRYLSQQRKNQQEAMLGVKKVTNVIDTLIPALKNRGLDISNPNAFTEENMHNQQIQELYTFWNTIYDYIINKKIVPADTAGSLGTTPLYLLVRIIIDPIGVKELIKSGANKEHITKIKLENGTFDTPQKAAGRIPVDSWKVQEKKAEILSTFGDSSLSDMLQEKQREYARAVEALQKDPQTTNTELNQGIVINLIKNHYINPDYQIPQLQGKTAFHVAAQTNNNDLGHNLYINNANILATDNNGNTVLHDASEMLENLAPNERVNNLFWNLLHDEYNRLLVAQHNEKQSGISSPMTIIPRNKEGKSPFDILSK